MPWVHERQLGKRISIWIKKHFGISKVIIDANRDSRFVSFVAAFPSEEAVWIAAGVEWVLSSSQRRAWEQ